MTWNYDSQFPRQPHTEAPPESSTASHIAVAAASTAVVATVLFAFVAGWAAHGVRSISAGQPDAPGPATGAARCSDPVEPVATRAQLTAGALERAAQ